ncbi:MAG: T9SS type A sorting domain-containing protein [Spirosomataceae bacterium]
MKKLSIIFAGCFATVAGHAQLVSSTDIFIGSGAIVTVNGELSNTGTFKSEGDLHLRNGLTNLGDMSLKGQVVMDGEGTQLIQSNSLIKTGTLVMSQMGKVVLRTPLLIERQLTLGDGILENNDQTILSIADGATVSGGSNRSHVKGYVRKSGSDEFRFPVGNGTHLQAFTVSKPGLYDEIQVGLINQNPSRLTAKRALEVEDLVADSYWSVQGLNEANPLAVSVNTETGNRQILQLRNSQWNITPTTSNGNALSSEAVLRGATYFTIGTQRPELAEKADVSIYPNPSNGAFEVRLKGFMPEENVSFDLIDMAGKSFIKQEGQVKDLKTKYALGNEVNNGSYILRVVRSGKNQVFNQKVSINR